VIWKIRGKEEKECNPQRTVLDCVELTTEDGVRPNKLSVHGKSLKCLGDIHDDAQPGKAANSSWGTKPWLKADMCQDLPFKPAWELRTERPTSTSAVCPTEVVTGALPGW